MDKRKNYYLIIDTEATAIQKIDKVDPHNMLVYDIGYAIIDKKGKIYRAASYVVKEIFYNPNLMNSAYYVNKLPQYYEEIENGMRIVKTLKEIQNELNMIITKLPIKAVIAHNAYFDYTALNTTIRYLNQGKYFFSYGTTIYDTLKMSMDAIGSLKGYTRFCEENDYLTQKGKPRFTAEILYRFLTGNNDFIESHTGLEDALIEGVIFVRCLNRKVKMRKTLFND